MLIKHILGLASLDESNYCWNASWKGKFHDSQSCRIVLYVYSVKSSIYNRNTNGLKTVPCGMSESTCIHAVRNFAIHYTLCSFVLGMLISSLVLNLLWFSINNTHMTSLNYPLVIQLFWDPLVTVVNMTIATVYGLVQWTVKINAILISMIFLVFSYILFHNFL